MPVLYVNAWHECEPAFGQERAVEQRPAAYSRAQVASEECGGEVRQLPKAIEC